MLRPRSTPLFTLCAALVLAFALSTTGCGKPTVEGAIASYKKAKDNLDASLAKVSPVTKIDVRKKIKEFEGEYKKAEALEGEAKMKAIFALTRRMKDYRTKIDPTAKKGTKATAGKGKLDKTKAATKPAAAPAKPSGKLGGTKLAPKPGATPPKSGPGSSGFKPGAAPTAAPAPAPTGGSGFGGK